MVCMFLLGCLALQFFGARAESNSAMSRAPVPSAPGANDPTLSLFLPTSSSKRGAVCQVPRWFHKAEDSVFKVGGFDDDFYRGDLAEKKWDTVYGNPAKSGILLYQAWYVPIMRIDVKDFLPDGTTISELNKALALHVSEVGDRLFKRFKHMRPEDMNDAFFGTYSSRQLSFRADVLCSRLSVCEAEKCGANTFVVHYSVLLGYPFCLSVRTGTLIPPPPSHPHPALEWQQQGGFKTHFLGKGKKAWAMNMLKDVVAHLLVKVGMHLGLDADVVRGFQELEQDRIKIRQGKKQPGTIDPENVSSSKRRVGIVFSLCTAIFMNNRRFYCRTSKCGRRSTLVPCITRCMITATLPYRGYTTSPFLKAQER